MNVYQLIIICLLIVHNFSGVSYTLPVDQATNNALTISDTPTVVIDTPETKPLLVPGVDYELPEVDFRLTQNLERPPIPGVDFELQGNDLTSPRKLESPPIPGVDFKLQGSGLTSPRELESPPIPGVDFKFQGSDLPFSQKVDHPPMPGIDYERPEIHVPLPGVDFIIPRPDFSMQGDGESWPMDGEIYLAEHSQITDVTVAINIEQTATSSSYASYIKIYDDKGVLMSGIFVGGEGKVTTELPKGTYIFKLGIGNAWYGPKSTFGKTGSYSTLLFNGGVERVTLEAGMEYEITINPYVITPETEQVGSMSESWENF
jgi:hypothetical protein